MDLGLRDKVALVTGASQGLGRAVAHALAAEGCRVALCARRPGPLQEAAREIAAATGTETHAIPGDVSLAAACPRIVAEAAARWGRLDILVANAGGPPTGPFTDFTDEQWQQAVDMNFLSAVRLIRAAVPYLRAAKATGGGAIIAITSVTVKQPMDNFVLSNSVRLGVVGLCKTLASELGPDGIRVNVVCPGWTWTERAESLVRARAERQGKTVDEVIADMLRDIPLRRVGKPEDLAALVAFLASERAGYITGTTIQVDGGFARGVM